MEVCDWISKPNLSFYWSEFCKYYDYRIVRAPNRLAPLYLLQITPVLMAVSGDDRLNGATKSVV